MRQTEYSFEELKDLSVDSRCDRCSVLNEIGEISLGNNEEAKQARNFLKGLLRNMNPSDRIYAFGYLSEATGLDQKTIDEIEIFEANPENIGIISGVIEQRKIRGS